MDAKPMHTSTGRILDRKGHDVDLNALRSWLIPRVPQLEGPWQITRFSDGFSNLTYLIEAAAGSCVLRTPPPGADIRSAHDMGREYKMLTALQPYFNKTPRPLVCCEDDAIIGTSFFVMSKVEGRIFRPQKHPEAFPTPSQMRSISCATVDILAELHSIDVKKDGLISLGYPDGYVNRQVNGWIKRYHQCATDEIDGIRDIEKWLLDNTPGSTDCSIIHNDFKYDNLVFAPDNDALVTAVLDWEMSTIGDPLMDLGTTLAYWSEMEDDPALKAYNLTWLPGNLTRAEVVDRYAVQRGIDRPNLCFYYVFGSYKIGVIVQQIYARFLRGQSSDRRFGGLTHVLKASMNQAISAIQQGYI
jgi:aminoglycoside phosphotransferase (APT) family kinase protein